ncbi:MAG TPA: nuclear transport factor 2 family protein [Candidatus Dormibacteraeota bacterium]|nr:nuclear transport factor 2 family protein [Candidatus Dormibacteraeota bacterium]
MPKARALNYPASRTIPEEYMPNSGYLQTAPKFAALLLLAFVAVTPAARSANEPPDRQADRSAIRAVLNAQQEAWNRGDIDAFLTGYWHSPDLTFSGSNGISRGWDAVLARYKKNYPDRSAMGVLDFSNLELRFLGPDAALVLGHWHLKREKDELGGVFTLVWQRFPEGWRIIHDHTSASPPDTNPK